ncbi:unnamed protein product, partial [Dovyalis caffra]
MITASKLGFINESLARPGVNIAIDIDEALYGIFRLGVAKSTHKPRNQFEIIY